MVTQSLYLKADLDLSFTYAGFVGSNSIYDCYTFSELFFDKDAQKYG